MVRWFSFGDIKKLITNMYAIFALLILVITAIGAYMLRHQQEIIDAQQIKIVESVNRIESLQDHVDELLYKANKHDCAELEE